MDNFIKIRYLRLVINTKIIPYLLVLGLIAIPSFAYASPSLNMTLNAAQTTPATTITDNGGNILWQFITNTFGKVATLISQKIVIYNSGLTHIRGYQLPDQNTTLVGLNTSNTWTNPNTFNSNATFRHLVLTNGQFINPNNEIMAINYSSPSTQYVIYNATTDYQIASGSDAGLVLQKGINALPVRGGLIYIHTGNYTILTPVLLNKSGTMISGEGFSSSWRPATSAIMLCNVGSANDCFTITAPSGNNWNNEIDHLTFTRASQHSARYLTACFTNHPCYHTVLNYDSWYDVNQANFADLTLQGVDYLTMEHPVAYRDHILAGNETQACEFFFSNNVEVYIHDAHFSANSANALGLNSDGLCISSDRMDKVTDSTFDFLRNPMTGTSYASVMFSNTGFFSNNVNKPVATSADFAGWWIDQGSNILTGINRVATDNMTFSNINNFTDYTDRTKAFQFVESGLNTNHIQKYTVPKANGTLSLQPIYNFTSPSNKTGTNSLTPVMYGGFATLTPRYSTNATISVSGYGYNTILNDGCYVSVQTSNANMGPNGATLAGTKLGSAIRFVSPTANANETFNIEVTDTTLSVGTKQFYDLGFRAVTGGICKLVNVNWNIREQ